MSNKIHEKYRTIGIKQLRHNALERDQSCTFDKKAWNALIQENFFGIMAPKEYGGDALSLSDSIAAHRGLAEGSLDLGFVFTVSVQSVLAIELLLKFGTADQKEKYLKPAIRGDIVFAISNAEHQAGTDMNKIKSSVKYDSAGKPFLSGNKTVCTNVPFADVVLLSAHNEKTGTFDIYLIDTNLGETQSWTDQLLGVRTGITGALYFDNVHISDIEQRRLGKPGQAPSILQACFDLDRLILAVMVSGCLRGLVDMAIENIQLRAEKDPEFAKHQYIQEKFYKVFSCAEKIDGLITMIVNDLPDREVLSALKQRRNTLSVLKELLCTEAYDAASDIFELFGFLSFKGDHLMQKILRDLMAFKFLGGTKELQKNMVFANYQKSSALKLKQKATISTLNTTPKKGKRSEPII